MDQMLKTLLNCIIMVFLRITNQKSHKLLRQQNLCMHEKQIKKLRIDQTLALLHERKILLCHEAT